MLFAFICLFIRCIRYISMHVLVNIIRALTALVLCLLSMYTYTVIILCIHKAVMCGVSYGFDKKKDVDATQNHFHLNATL